ncbi:transporter substrate-binding domain-containing protein [Bifidobacterium simiarum]|nr:transporter substrate-binding domain-containing protein [Bifidobacterium simiarum]
MSASREPLTAPCHRSGHRLRRRSLRRPSCRPRRAGRLLVRALSAVVALALCLPLAACGQTDPLGASEVVGPRLAIGVAYDQPSMGYRKGDDYSGLDVEVARYVANRLGYADWQIVWENAPEADRDRMLASGEVDMIVGVFVDDSQNVDDLGFDFAGAYLTERQAVMVRRRGGAPIDSLNALRGRKACVVRGSRSVEQMRRKFGSSVSLIQQPGSTQCATALLSGMVDAVVAPGAVLAGLHSAGNDDTTRILSERFGDEGRYGVALPSGSTQLEHRVDLALRRMHRDGTWDRAWNRTLGAIGYETDRSR